MNTGPLSPKELERLAELLRARGMKAASEGTEFVVHFDGPESTIWFDAEDPDSEPLQCQFIVWAMEQIEGLRPGSHLEKFKTGDVYRVGISQPFTDHETIWANGPNLCSALARALLVVLEEKNVVRS